MTTWAGIVRRGAFGLVVVAGLLGLGACLPTGVGDPAKSKVDERLIGIWEWRDGLTMHAMVRAWDERTYLVDIMGTETTADAVERPRARYVYKAWLTEIRGSRS